MAYWKSRASPAAHKVLVSFAVLDSDNSSVNVPLADDPLTLAFQQLSHCLQVVNSLEFNKAWAIYIQTSPQTFYDRLTSALPYDTSVSFNINIDGTGYINIKIKDGLREVAEANRTFSLTMREAHNHAFVIWHPEDRGVGIARAVLRNTFALFKSWGIRRVFCSAGLDDGAYTWARYGFKVPLAEWTDLQPQLVARLYNLRLSWQDQEGIRRLIEIDDPMGLWFVSDLAGSVEVGETDGFGGPRTYSIGRALLEGLNWKGYFEFEDAACVERFERRVGGIL